MPAYAEGWGNESAENEPVTAAKDGPEADDIRVYQPSNQGLRPGTCGSYGLAETA